MADTESGALLESIGMGSSRKQSCCPSLTFTQRMIGFGICLFVGLVLEIVSFVCFFSGVDLTRFAILYSLGNLVTVIGTFFLVGPAKQFKKMADKTRLVTSICYILSIIMTLISAIVIKNNLAVILFLILQFVSFFWYSLSYIPYARRLFTFCCKNIVE